MVWAAIVRYGAFAWRWIGPLLGFGRGKMVMWGVLALAVAVGGTFFVTKFYLLVRDAERGKIFEQKLDEANARIRVKDKQLEAAANRPSPHELDRVLTDGTF